MNSVLTYALPIALAAVTIVLLMGLFNMMRRGSPRRSQSLMRWRIILQFVAIIIALGILLATQGSA